MSEEDPLDVETWTSDLRADSRAPYDESTTISSVSLMDTMPRKRKRSSSDIRRKTFPGSYLDERPSEDSITGSECSAISADRCATIKTETWGEFEPQPDFERDQKQAFAVRSKDSLEPCQICGEIFPSQQELSKHFKMRHVRGLKSVGVKKDWPCKACGEKFKQASELKAHKAQKHEGGPCTAQKSEVSNSLCANFR